MPQRINLRDSALLYKAAKTVYIILAFFHIALLLRFLILLPLVGRKFLSGGIEQFLECVYILDFFTILVLSIAKLVPITPAFHLLNNIVEGFIIGKILREQDDVKRHSSYGLIIFIWSINKSLNYIYHYYKLKTLNRSVPQLWRSLHVYITLVTYPLQAILEFILLFLSLRNLLGYWNLTAQIILLLFVPTKGFLYKRLVVKYFKDEKND